MLSIDASHSLLSQPLLSQDAEGFRSDGDVGGAQEGSFEFALLRPFAVHLDELSLVSFPPFLLLSQTFVNEGYQLLRFLDLL